MTLFTGRIAILAFLLLSLLPLPAAAELDLVALIRNVEQQYWGVSSHAFVQMRVRTDRWQRTMEMESWSLGRERFLTRILSPAKEKGVTTLKVDDQVWNYLPKVDRTMKIPPSLMGGAWMGSHITNDDLVKADKVDQDYSFRLLEETAADWRVECLPNPDAAVIWGKIIYLIDKPSRTPLEVAYYDEAGVRVRRMLFSQLTRVGDRMVPLTLTVIPDDKPDESTEMIYRDLSFDVPLDASFFSLRNLKGR